MLFLLLLSCICCVQIILWTLRVYCGSNVHWSFTFVYCRKMGAETCVPKPNLFLWLCCIHVLSVPLMLYIHHYLGLHLGVYSNLLLLYVLISCWLCLIVIRSPSNFICCLNYCSINKDMPIIILILFHTLFWITQQPFANILSGMWSHMLPGYWGACDITRQLQFLPDSHYSDKL